MPNPAVILACCDALEATVAALDRVANRTDHDRKRDLIMLRQQLSAQLAALHDGVMAGEGPLAEGPLIEEFRTRFSALRNSVAIHQASFPAVLLDETANEYRTSGLQSSALLRNMIVWIRHAVKKGSQA